MATVATPSRLLTIEEYAALPDDGRFTELVRGEIVEMNPPQSRHGLVCARTVRLVGNFVDDRDLGQVACNDTGVITHRNPDTLRGADVAFYSFAKLPRGEKPIGYLAVPPDAVFEIMSPSNTWGDMLEKVAEYLKAGVRIVCVIDPEDEVICVYLPDRAVRVVPLGEDLVLDDPLPGFRVPVARFFE